jgi:signal transduction histidine kinase
MTSFKALGLRTRIILVFASVMVLFILLTEISVAGLVRIAMTRQSIAAGGPEDFGSERQNLKQDIAKLRELIRFYIIMGAVSALILGSVAITRFVVVPLTRVTNAVEHVAEGRLDAEVPIAGAKELIRLSAAFNRMTSTLREQQDELRRRLAQLEKSTADLKEVQDRLIRAAKLASVGTLAAGVAHEIGNPLAGVLGLLDALDAGAEEKEAEQYRKLMRKEIQRIDRTIDELLLYARPSGAAPDGSQCASVEEVLEHVRALLGAQRLFDKIEFHVDFDGGPFQVAILADDLTQVLINLLLNAAQAMEGKGSIGIEVERVEGWRPAFGAVLRDAIRIDISDTGPGVAKEHAKNIFDPFFSTKSVGQGSGLGLAICNSICDKAGGEIALDQEYGPGSRFRITLPAAQLKSAPKREERSSRT